MQLIPKDESHDALVVIPTVGDPEVLIPTVARLCRFTDGKRLVIALAVNGPPEDRDKIAEGIKACSQMCVEAQVHMVLHEEDAPIGFGAANNRGLIAAIDQLGGVPPLTVFFNDDAHVSEGWLDGLLAATTTSVVCGQSEPWDAEDPTAIRTPRATSEYGHIGIVAPVSNLVAGQQLLNVIHLPNNQVVQFDGDTDNFAMHAKARFGGMYVTSSFISGFCVGFTRECLSDLMLKVVNGSLARTGEEDPPSQFDQQPFPEGTTDDVLGLGSGTIVGPWDEEWFPIAGYEDNDIMVRCEQAGWRPVIAKGVFIGHLGHQTFDRLFPDQQRGLRNRMAFYEKWKTYTQREQHLSAVARVRFEVGNDVHVFRHSLLKLASLVDSVGILLTANPLEVREDPNWEHEQTQLHPNDLEYLDMCRGKPAEVVAAITIGWIAKILSEAPATRFTGDPKEWAMEAVNVRVHAAMEMNEKVERNISHMIGEELGADWILSFDADEVPEARLTREHFERWMKHPDPGVMAYDQSWMNLWDSGRLQREDHPWGDDGKYIGGMHGFRLWRVARQLDGTLVSPRRIIAGDPPHFLHNGNCPDFGPFAKRLSAFRWRHYGYVRVQDRHRRHARYQRWDPNPNHLLTGNPDGYSHVLNEEGMRLTPINPRNGIGLHFLMHEGETVHDFGRRLDEHYGLADRIVVVWTGEWSEGDKSWLKATPTPIHAAVRERAEAIATWDAAAAAGTPPHQLGPRPTSLRAAQRCADDPVAIPWYSTGPSREVALLGRAFGVEWVHQPLNDDLGAARSAALEALEVGAHEIGMGWAYYIDLDEHYPHAFAIGVALRRMAEVTDAAGWMLSFANHHQGREPSLSQSIRMARLDPRLRIIGRVHETYDPSLAELYEKGELLQIRNTSWIVHHQGLAADDDRMGQKLRRYYDWLHLELADRPHNSAAWVSLGLHHLNDGRVEKAQECMERGVLCAGNGYLPYREMAFMMLRKAQTFLGEALRRSGEGLGYHQAALPLWNALKEHVKPHPILGRGPHGNGPQTTPDRPLPAFTPPSSLGGMVEVQKLYEKPPFPTPEQDAFFGDG